MTPDERRDVLLAELGRLRRGETGAVGLAGARVVAGAQMLAANLVPDPDNTDRLRVEVGRWQADDDDILAPIGGDLMALGITDLIEASALLDRAEDALPAGLADLDDGACLAELASGPGLVVTLAELPGGTRWLALAGRQPGAVVGVPVGERDRLGFVLRMAAELVAAAGGGFVAVRMPGHGG